MTLCNSDGNPSAHLLRSKALFSPFPLLGWNQSAERGGGGIAFQIQRNGRLEEVKIFVFFPVKFYEREKILFVVAANLIFFAINFFQHMIRTLNVKVHLSISFLLLGDFL